jgi:glycosyltransferase involved in cell wall biosynthesis
MNGVMYTYDAFGNIPLEHHYPVIWLASWYPSRTSPSNGDFIQRHAEAVARYMPILVIHAIHDKQLVAPWALEYKRAGGLTELSLYFRQDEPEGPWSRLTYNLAFYQHTRKLVRSVMERCGKPAAFHVHVPMKLGRLAIWARRNLDIPYLVSEHSSKYTGDAEDSFRNRSFMHRWGVRQVFRQAAAITNVSISVGEWIRKEFRTDEVRVIRNVADKALFRYTGRNASVPFRFLHASTLTEQKNARGLLRAFRELYRIRQDFELVVIGNSLPSVCEDPWLVGKGLVEHREVARLMQESDALVLFSREENFPCVIVEALCSGLPVITSDVGGSAEAIHAGNGLVVTSGDEKALLRALQSMMDGAVRYDRAAISAEALGNYSYESIGGQFTALYRDLGFLA